MLTPLQGIPAWAWSALFLVIIFSLNSLSVRVYGESEYWLALIKVVTVIVSLQLVLLTIVGIMGWSCCRIQKYLIKVRGPILGGNLGGSLSSILGAFLIAGFFHSKVPELIGITAGESENPERADAESD